jgi:hypothetical protein
MASDVKVKPKVDPKVKVKQEARAKELEKKFQAQSFGAWLRAHTPGHRDPARPGAAEALPGGGAEAKEVSQARVENMRDEDVNAMLRSTLGSHMSKSLTAAFNTYKAKISSDYGKAVGEGQATGDIAADRNFKAPDDSAYARAANAASSRSDPALQNARDKAASTGAFSADNIAGTAQQTFSYDGFAKVLNTNPEDTFTNSLQAAGGKGFDITNPSFRVAVSGGGMDVQQEPLDVAARQAALQADPKAKPGPGQLGRKDVSGVGAMLGGASAMLGTNKSYPESMAYIQTLSRDQLVRLQQHLAMSGYYSDDELAHNGIMWGFPDAATVRAWATFHQESYSTKLSLAELMQRREVGYAPHLQSLMKTTAAGASGLDGGAVTVEVTDENTIRSATQDLFLKALGRAPTQAEENQAIASIQTSQRAEGQQRVDAAKGVQAAKKAKLNPGSTATSFLAGAAVGVERQHLAPHRQAVHRAHGYRQDLNNYGVRAASRRRSCAGRQGDGDAQGLHEPVVRPGSQLRLVPLARPSRSSTVTLAWDAPTGAQCPGQQRPRRQPMGNTSVGNPDDIGAVLGVGAQVRWPADLQSRPETTATTP